MCSSRALRGCCAHRGCVCPASIGHRSSLALAAENDRRSKHSRPTPAVRAVVLQSQLYLPRTPSAPPVCQRSICDQSVRDPTLHCTTGSGSMQRSDANPGGKATSSSVGGMRTRNISPKMREVLLQCGEWRVAGRLHASGTAAHRSTWISNSCSSLSTQIELMQRSLSGVL